MKLGGEDLEGVGRGKEYNQNIFRKTLNKKQRES